MKIEFIGLVVLMAVVLSGCEEGAPPAQNTQPAAQPAQQQPVAQPAPPVQQQQPAPVQPQQPAAVQQAQQTAAPGTPIIQGDANQAAPDMVRQKAQRGMGKKGQGYGGGIITQPISTYFQTRDRIKFSVQIPHQMKMFKAMNNRYPKDLDEYMDKIIKPLNTTLPELPAGHKYVYDPKTGELLVERPR